MNNEFENKKTPIYKIYYRYLFKTRYLTYSLILLMIIVFIFQIVNFQKGKNKFITFSEITADDIIEIKGELNKSNLVINISLNDKRSKEQLLNLIKSGHKGERPEGIGLFDTQLFLHVISSNEEYTVTLLKHDSLNNLKVIYRFKGMTYYYDVVDDSGILKGIIKDRFDIDLE